MSNYPPRNVYGSQGSFGSSGGYGSQSVYGGPGAYGGHGTYGGHGAYGSSYGSSPVSSLAPSVFAPEMDSGLVAAFRAADLDDSGFIDDRELQQSVSSYHQSFSLRTVHLLMYHFSNSNVRRIGPQEFSSLVHRLQNWRFIFERFDRDRSGRIDAYELRDALLSLGLSVSPMVFDLLVSKYDKFGGMNRDIDYDNFIECCLVVKGQTDKFRERDTNMSGSVTMNYGTFLLFFSTIPNRLSYCF